MSKRERHERALGLMRGAHPREIKKFEVHT